VESIVDFFEEAVAVHIAWKSRIRDHVAGRGKPLNASDIDRDDLCDLGGWLMGEGKVYASLPAWQALREAHQRFHSCAAEVVRRHDAGNTAGVENLLASDGEYFTASSETVVAIGNLRAAIESDRGY
jgi:hypothetical protein